MIYVETEDVGIPIALVVVMLPIRKIDEEGNEWVEEESVETVVLVLESLARNAPKPTIRINAITITAAIPSEIALFLPFRKTKFVLKNDTGLFEPIR